MLHLLLAFGMLAADAGASTAPVNLGTAGNYVILAKSGVTTTGATAITGNLGVSPIATTAFTGFGETLSSNGQYATSPLVNGRLYAADMAAPTPTVLTTAVGDMGTAYTDAANRTPPNFVDLGAGDISGFTLTPGVYKWSSQVLINADVTLQGNPNDVWIFQIAQNLVMGSSTSILLTGGAQAANVFWQVAGQTTIGTGAHFEGTILCATAVVMNTGASLNGHILAQTAVTLDGNTINASILSVSPSPSPTTEAAPPSHSPSISAPTRPSPRVSSVPSPSPSALLSPVPAGSPAPASPVPSLSPSLSASSSPSISEAPSPFPSGSPSPISPASTGKQCVNAIPITLKDCTRRFIDPLVCLEPGGRMVSCPGNECQNAMCGVPNDCNDKKWYLVTLDFLVDDWGQFDAIWVGAKACGCDTTVSVYKSCCEWQSTGAFCNGAIVYRPTDPTAPPAAVLLGVAARFGECCSLIAVRDAESNWGWTGGAAYGGSCTQFQCCFDVQITATPWKPTVCPPDFRCSKLLPFKAPSPEPVSLLLRLRRLMRTALPFPLLPSLLDWLHSFSPRNLRVPPFLD